MKELSTRLRRKCDITIILPLVHHLGANCFVLSFAMPVFAEELECREKPEHFFEAGPTPFVRRGA